MRVDKYIWAVRLFKTRSQAAKACSGERVLINGEFAKASKLLKDNDVISIKSTPIWRTFIVIDYPKSRVGPKLVNEYVKETTSISELEKLKQYELVNRQNKSLGIKGRPTKKDRRNLGKWFD